jgi:beta-glucosidase-like glycosyl hydrolase
MVVLCCKISIKRYNGIIVKNYEEGVLMKKLTELKFEELTLDQKLGMVHAAMINGNAKEEEIEYVFERIKNRALGAIWIQYGMKDWQEFLKRVHETADYPILIITDCENGIDEYQVGRHNPIACTGDEKYAYAFGKAVGFTAKNYGYNVVCNPVLDIDNNGFVRCFGKDKNVIAKMGSAEARGMHDAGVLTVGKHYPSGRNEKNIDAHMAESVSSQTREQLLDDSLFAYVKMMEAGLIDGVMTSHQKFSNIDDKYPASLSKKVIDVIRDEGFNGFCITDALGMMGIRAKFGDAESKGLAIAAGNDLALTYTNKPRFDQEAINTAYEKGVISDEQLNECVKRILLAQHKVMVLDENRCKELTDEEIALCKDIPKVSVCAQADEGLTPTISKDGKHLFAVMVRNEMELGKVEVDTFSNGWLFPDKITKKIMELFPNSKVRLFHEFPTQHHNHGIFQDSVTHDDVIFLTFSEPLAYAGKEALTSRVLSLIECLQFTNRVSALLHFGNPCILGDLPHIPRVILGGINNESVDASLEILAGERKATGVKTFDIKLN